MYRVSFNDVFTKTSNEICVAHRCWGYSPREGDHTQIVNGIAPWSFRRSRLVLLLSPPTLSGVSGADGRLGHSSVAGPMFKTQKYLHLSGKWLPLTNPLHHPQINLPIFNNSGVFSWGEGRPMKVGRRLKKRILNVQLKFGWKGQSQPLLAKFLIIRALCTCTQKLFHSLINNNNI